MAQWIVGAAVALMIAGFEVLSFVAVLGGYESRFIMLPFRGVMAATLAGVFAASFYFGRQHRPNGLMVTLLVGFWLMYSARVLTDAWLVPIAMMRPANEYLMYALGVTLPAAIGFIFVTSPELYRVAPRMLFVLFALSCSLAILNVVRDPYARSIRMSGNEFLGPIPLGHAGVSTVLLTIYLAQRSRAHGRKSEWVLRAAYVGAAVVGLTALLLSASRGPFVALIVAAPVAFVYSSGRARVRAALVVLAVAMSAAGAVEFAYSTGVRLDLFLGSSAAFLESTSTLNRYTMIGAAWGQFLESPLVGSGLVEQYSMTYPHNVVIEAFMATGIVGGLLFVVLLVLAAATAARLLRHPQLQWVSLLFVQYGVGAMFSGSIGFAYQMWTAIGLLAALGGGRLSMAGTRGSQELRTAFDLRSGLSRVVTR